MIIKYMMMEMELSQWGFVSFCWYKPPKGGFLLTLEIIKIIGIFSLNVVKYNYGKEKDCLYDQFRKQS